MFTQNHKNLGHKGKKVYNATMSTMLVLVMSTETLTYFNLLPF